jgi:hypothetical protein
MSDSWLQIIALFIANLGIILWFRAESRADLRHSDVKMEALRREHAEFRELMLIEIKDFHGRLCAIEERRLRKK